ncbi:hypothetical protein JX266_002348 [Neoarthrinium moseri]|nr:hypothetical protein JX266_002348 [Neoarthrinium moseri]
MDPIDATRRVNRTEGPPEVEWNKHRATIEKLYMGDGKTLAEVAQWMQLNRNFKANTRMYRTRFRAWKIYKNLKSDQKTKMLLQIIEGQPQSTTLRGMQLDPKDQRRLSRHLKTMVSKFQEKSLDGNENDDEKVHAELSQKKEPDDDADSLKTPSPEPGGPSSAMRNRTPGVIEPIRIANPIQPGREFRTAELIFKTISELCFATKSCITYNTTESTFWSNITHGIYFLKVDSPHLAWPVINTACQAATKEIADSTGLFILGLVTTLAPVNMALCQDLRLSLLKYMVELAESSLGARHPLSILARELQRLDEQDWVSDCALSCTIDSFKKALGPGHDLTFAAQLRRIATLRRLGHYEQALTFGHTALAAAKASHGDSSLQARRITRYLAHVHMDMKSYTEALALCLSVVDELGPREWGADESRVDECALYAMEDIAKIHEASGDAAQSVAWLTQAAMSAVRLGKSGSEASHVVEKLVRVLSENGRADEAELWRRFSPAPLSV